LASQFKDFNAMNVLVGRLKVKDMVAKHENKTFMPFLAITFRFLNPNVASSSTNVVMLKFLMKKTPFFRQVKMLCKFY
jgi:hypothetical protein